MNGYTLDTGALIALEGRQPRVIALLEAARIRNLPVTVPVVVVLEWWRGQRGPAARLLDAMRVEPLREPLARVAGEALRRIGPGPSIADAAVMASAAQRGDGVLTSDLGDFQRLQTVFPEVRLLGV